MFPPIIIIDKSGPEEGADIFQDHILVQEKNKELLINGYTTFFPGIKYKIMTKEEYINDLEKKKEIGKAEESSDTDHL